MPHAKLSEGTKVCSNPDCVSQGEPQPLEKFSSDKNRPDGLASRCKAYVSQLRSRKNRFRATPVGLMERREERKIAKAENQANETLGVLAKLQSNGKGKTPKITHIEELAGAAMQAAGGAKQWGDRLIRAIDGSENAGHKIRGLLGIATICKDAAIVQAANAQDLDLCSDDDLNERIRQIVQQMQSENAVDVEFVKQVEVSDRDLG